MPRHRRLEDNISKTTLYRWAKEQTTQELEDIGFQRQSMRYSAEIESSVTSKNESSVEAINNKGQ